MGHTMMPWTLCEHCGRYSRPLVSMAMLRFLRQCSDCGRPGLRLVGPPPPRARLQRDRA